jgi:hypothetical protein
MIATLAFWSAASLSACFTQEAVAGLMSPLSSSE